ncbi:molybdopterin molybdotransferase MoeA [Tautonia plasticadhaerens]|uniref:Molybdopterin molybdenumtransferase n=1 Tax=Tautonia plasticadhaerens TaxID=2527974 RepID=A0A518H2S0_9BACT|nr:gephyrin-like molybdotransferase Glp [Tautonia plasticadhaerens]QDV35135.1 Molybdopterin molybdenumtransferase [Tautonia plasticadhaerens]
MLSVAEALRAVLDHAAPLPPRRVGLSEALGCALAESVTADRDLPPFDKALLDGFAVRSADLAGPVPFELEVIEEITAGRVPTRSLGPGQCSAIMTGAPMPDGADAVVMVEDSDRRGARVLLSPRKPVSPDAGRLTRGREMRQGEGLLSPGARLDPVKLGLLASVGHADPLVAPRPVVTIASTGDELVPPDQVPGPGQIRNSNATVLEGLVRASSGLPDVAPIAPDVPEALRAVLSRGLANDVLLVTGGVSAGKLDLVPGTLAELGMTAVFHKIRLKPGKPLLFGIGPPRADGRPGTLVFGLPGNPVSGVVGFLLFVAPALKALRGLGAEPPEAIPARLSKPFSHRGDRPTYYPARLLDRGEPGGPAVEPLDWAGSADLRTVATADGFASFEAGDRDYEPGTPVPFLPLPRPD